MKNSTRAHDQFLRLREAFPHPKGADRTTDLLSLRLAEELRLLQRVIEMVERGLSGAEAKALRRTEAAIEDIADVVEAREPCDAIQTIDPDMARRLARRTIDGKDSPCEKRWAEQRLANNDSR